VKRGTIAAAAAATLALVGTPALVGTAQAAPSEKGSAAGAKSHKVQPSKWGSYVVVMTTDPLVATIGQKDLGSTKAQREASQKEAKHSAVLKRAGISSSNKLNDYTASLDGFSVLASPTQADKLAADPDVLLVLPDELRQAQAVSSAPLGAGDIDKGTEGESLSSFLGLDDEYKGDNELLGVIDSGIWPEHPSFADDGSYPTLKLPDARGGYKKCDFGHGKNDPSFKCNNKLVGARQMLKTYRKVVGTLPGEFDSARDDDGHGTHTASTAAGNADVPAWIYDESTTMDHTSGVAPRAQIVAYKALGSLGGFTSDLAAAIDQAVYDGVDVINYSIGGGPGLLSGDAISFLYANAAGVHVATSAGNSGPGDATIGGPADLPWLTTVGASTQPRFYGGTVRLGDGREVLGSSVTLESEADLPLVDAATIGNKYCLGKAALDDDAKFATFEAGAKGKMVLCWRGLSGRSEKSLHVLEAGGKAMVLSNTNDVDNYFTDNFRVPTVMVDSSEGEVIASYAATAGATASIVDTQKIEELTSAPSMAVFSSRGPNPSSPSIVKPDITAPGVQVLAGASPMPVGDDYEPGQLFQAIAGTSMSSPVMAGMFLRLDQQHPGWSPASVKSAVMTTAYQDVVDNDRVTPASPLDFGAGHVNAPLTAGSPSLVYNAGFGDFLAYLCQAAPGSVGAASCTKYGPLAPTVEDLNYPTIGVSSLAGVAKVHRTVTNVSGSDATFTVATDAPEGVDMTVTPTELTIPDGKTASYDVTFTNVDAPVNTEWRFGSLTWTGGSGADVRSNIAVYPTAFSAPDLVQGSGAAGSTSFDVTAGFSGTYVPVASGLAANEPITGTVSFDADQTFDGCQDQPGTTAKEVVVAADTDYVRMSYVDPNTSDDIDLYLCDGDGNVVAESTAGGTNELIELASPDAGTYTLYVHGWQVAVDGTPFSIDTWKVVAGDGSLTVSPDSATVTPGQTVRVTASWTGAPAGTSFGVVNHTKDGVTYDQTVVEVDS
jgi:hypothetical protein